MLVSLASLGPARLVGRVFLWGGFLAAVGAAYETADPKMKASIRLHFLEGLPEESEADITGDPTLVVFQKDHLASMVTAVCVWGRIDLASFSFTHESLLKSPGKLKVRSCTVSN